MNTQPSVPNGTSLLSRSKDRIEIREIIGGLTGHHALFTVLASADVIADDQYPFAYITMQGERPCIGINYAWWETRDQMQHAFVLVHEALHFMFGHLWQETVERVAPPDTRGDNWRMVYAYAIDLMVNCATQRIFGMRRDLVDPEKQFVWAETIYQRIFKSAAPGVLEWGKFLRDSKLSPVNFSYYSDAFMGTPRTLAEWYAYAEWLLAKAARAGRSLPKFKEIEMHMNEDTGQDTASQQDQAQKFMQGKMKDGAFKKSARKIAQGMEGPNGAGEGLVQSVGAGKQESDLETLVLGDPLKLQKSWASLVRRWNLTHRKNEDKVGYDWTRMDPRYALVADNHVVLPREIELDPDLNRTNVLIYLDFSASCAKESAAFLRLALTIPQDRFDVRFVAFAMRVQEITREEAEQFLVAGRYPTGIGSGTDFEAITNHVNQQVKVRNVFVITDGDADSIHMREPKKWSWLQIKNAYAGDLQWALNAGAHHGWIIPANPNH